MKGVEGKLDYLEKNNVNYIHLMPFLETPKGRSDGGYAVADFRKVQENLGTMDDLKELTGACHKKGISVCMDFVMNHTSEDHEWAEKPARVTGVHEQILLFSTIRTFLLFMRKPYRRYFQPQRQAILPGFRNRPLCYDDLLSIPVGSELQKPAGI
ncbi:MAG: alpha-amylase family glycosyl hydrolase [Ruminococcus sp.]